MKLPRRAVDISNTLTYVAFVRFRPCRRNRPCRRERPPMGDAGNSRRRSRIHREDRDGVSQKRTRRRQRASRSGSGET